MHAKGNKDDTGQSLKKKHCQRLARVVTMIFGYIPDASHANGHNRPRNGVNRRI